MNIRLVFLVLILVFAALPLFGEEVYCKKCVKEIVNDTLYASCVGAQDHEEGNTGCNVPRELDADCNFTGSACVTYLAPINECYDVNHNHICDKDEDIGSCGPNDPVDQCASPLVIGDGEYYFSGAANPVLFDINADGVPDRLTWTAAGSGVRFLWLDLNRNGIVDNGKELFGNHTSRAAWNGFVALAQWDAPPYNGLIDEFDQVWPSLQLWEDVNHDGVSQAEEITWLADSGITALGLDYDVKRKEDDAGNRLRFRAELWRGTKKDKYYDVYFVFVP